MHWRAISTLSLILIAVGCERGSTTSAPATKPVVAQATQPVAPASAPMLPAQIWVDDRMYEFPPARVILRTRDDQMLALLFSDDPPSAIDDSYTGNSFYLELTDLETPEPGKLTNATWTFKASNSERAESASGIFLQGRKYQLQPFEVQILFQGSDSPMSARMAGTFLMFEGDDAKVPGKMVTVRAELTVARRVKSTDKPVSAAKG